MERLATDIGGVVLAGGKGRRLGFPKELLEIGGEKVIDRVLRVMRELFEEVLLVTDRRERFAELSGVCVVEDLLPGCGPLGGIYSALKLTGREKVFVVACDMPFLQSGLIEKLLEIARKRDPDCVIPRNPKGFEPLHAVYSVRVLSEFEQALAGDDLSISGVYSRLNTYYLETTPDEFPSFFNINTREDLDFITDGNKIQEVPI